MRARERFKLLGPRDRIRLIKFRTAKKTQFGGAGSGTRLWADLRRPKVLESPSATTAQLKSCPSSAARAAPFLGFRV